uniref:Uncharacterized protein n=1 Tax=Arcella intermedia TaxID=1963864 RepID=A0A6B2LF49_9EUKA
MVGDIAFICNNGNFISLSGSSVSSSNYVLDGNLAVEGELIFENSIELEVTAESAIVVSDTISVPLTSTFHIDFQNISFTEINSIILNKDGSFSIQIIKAASFLGNFSLVTFKNSEKSICNYNLIPSGGLLLRFQTCNDDSSQQSSSAVPFITIAISVTIRLLLVLCYWYWWDNLLHPSTEHNAISS